jgi:hypothetical protein
MFCAYIKIMNITCIITHMKFILLQGNFHDIIDKQNFAYILPPNM